MVYRGFEYQYSEDNDFVLKLDKRTTIIFETDREMFEYVDDLLESDEDIEENKIQYYIYRIHRNDQDMYRNYQYFDGRYFKYSVQDICYMDYENAKQYIDRFRRRNDGYIYRLSST